jgi:uncharacterized damage-inducible protein DinB
MRIREYATAMAAYNRWMNEGLYGKAGELTDEERKRDLGAFFKSIHATLNHILLADLWWIQRFRGEPLEKRTLGEELYSDFRELTVARAAMDAKIIDWAAQVTDEFADSELRFFSVTYGRERVLPYWAAIVQLFNHGTHHRGQVTTLLKQLGNDPGVTDFPWMPYFDPPPS